MVGVSRDERPDYAHDSGLSGALRQTRFGFRSLWTDPPLRLLGSAFTILVFFEGAADVLVVVVALQLLGLAQGSVGYLNAAWGVGALVGGAVLALLLHRGNLSAGLVVGALVAGVAMALPSAWPVAVAAYAGWIGTGIGYTFVEVTVRTLLQRLGSDEVLGRVLGSLETSRLAAMAAGSIVAPGLVALLVIRGALIAMGAILPLFAFMRWRLLRQFEAGTPVSERLFVAAYKLDLRPASCRDLGAALSVRSPCCATSRARRRYGRCAGRGCWHWSASAFLPRSQDTSAATKQLARSSILGFRRRLPVARSTSYWAVIPPSARTTEPGRKLASSEARKRARFAISRGSPGRPIG